MNKTIKYLWITSGILIFIWTAFWFWKVVISGKSTIASNVVNLTIGYYLIVLYIIVAIVYWINRELYKRKTKKLRRK